MSILKSVGKKRKYQTKKQLAIKALRAYTKELGESDDIWTPEAAIAFRTGWKESNIKNITMDTKSLGYNTTIIHAENARSGTLVKLIWNQASGAVS